MRLSLINPGLGLVGDPLLSLFADEELVFCFFALESSEGTEDAEVEFGGDVSLSFTGATRLRPERRAEAASSAREAEVADMSCDEGGVGNEFTED